MNRRLSLHRNLQVRLAGETLIQTFYWMFFPFMALLFTERYGHGMAGLLLMLPHLFSIMASLVGGYLADTMGRKATMAAAMLGQSLCFLLFVLAEVPLVQLLAYIGLSSAYSLYLPASQAMAADLTTEDERRQVFAKFQMAFHIGMVAGPVLGAIFFDQYFFGVILGGAVVIALYGLAILRLFAETLPEEARNRQQNKPLADRWKEQLGSYGMIFRDRVFGLFILSGTLLAIVFMQPTLYMAVYVKTVVQPQPLFQWGEFALQVNRATTYGWMMGLNGMLIMLFTVGVTKRLSHWSDRRTLLVSSLLIGMALFWMSFVQSPWLLFGCMALFSLGEMIRTPAAQGFLSKYAPPERRGQYMGAASLQMMGGRLLAPTLIGLAGILPPMAVFALMLWLAVFAAAGYHVMFRAWEKASRPHN